jgi:hypothetical protein
VVVYALFCCISVAFLVSFRCLSSSTTTLCKSLTYSQCAAVSNNSFVLCVVCSLFLRYFVVYAWCFLFLFALCIVHWRLHHACLFALFTVHPRILISYVILTQRVNTITPLTMCSRRKCGRCCSRRTGHKWFFYVTFTHLIPLIQLSPWTSPFIYLFKLIDTAVTVEAVGGSCVLANNAWDAATSKPATECYLFRYSPKPHNLLTIIPLYSRHCFVTYVNLTIYSLFYHYTAVILSLLT